MGLELVPTGDINSNELLEKLQALRQPPSAPSSPSLPPASPSLSKANTPFLDCATAISKDGTLFAIGRTNLLLLFKVGGNWKITKLIEDESTAQPG